MIYCVWYPSGGFGHYIGATLSLYGKNFARPKKDLTFNANGDSHNVVPPAAKWEKDPETFAARRGFSVFDPTSLTNTPQLENK